jgi:hypothetical protein
MRGGDAQSDNVFVKDSPAQAQQQAKRLNALASTDHAGQEPIEKGKLGSSGRQVRQAKPRPGRRTTFLNFLDARKRHIHLQSETGSLFNNRRPVYQPKPSCFLKKTGFVLFFNNLGPPRERWHQG